MVRPRKGNANSPMIDIKTIGFARLVGEDFEYHMQKYSVTLGRNTGDSTVDVCLGDGQKISPLHARIFYDFSLRRFSLEVIGRNGCLVEGALHRPGNEPVELKSQDLIQIGKKQFYFLLPSRQLFSNATEIITAEQHQQLQQQQQLQLQLQQQFGHSFQVHHRLKQPAEMQQNDYQNQDIVMMGMESSTVPPQTLPLHTQIGHYRKMIARESNYIGESSTRSEKNIAEEKEKKEKGKEHGNTEDMTGMSKSKH